MNAMVAAPRARIRARRAGGRGLYG